MLEFAFVACTLLLVVGAVLIRRCFAFEARALLMCTVIAICLFGGSAVLYSSIGAWGYSDRPLQQRFAAAENRYRGRPSQTIAEQAIVNAEPSVATTQANLIALYQAQQNALDEFDDTAPPQAHVNTLTALASLMVEATGGYVSPEAESVIQQLLTIAPENPAGLYYQGAMLQQIGRDDLALPLWRNVIESAAVDNVWRALIIADIAAMATRAGVRYTPPAQ